MSEQQGLDRRTALVWAGALAAALGTGHYFGLNLSGPNKAVVPGYGRDPDMLNPVVPWPRIMTAAQLAAAKTFADFILPREGSAPSASEVGIHELVDEWISAPYPAQAKDNGLILDGLAQMDFQAKRRGGAASFAAAPKDIQAAILADLAKGAAPAGFYKRLRQLVVAAYYTTDAGFADIGYIGNVALAAFPAPTAEVTARLEQAYQQLGLVDRVERKD